MSTFVIFTQYLTILFKHIIWLDNHLAETQIAMVMGYAKDKHKCSADSK